MFTRDDLFRVRAVVVERFFEATDQKERDRAMALILKINERLLRASRERIIRTPHWSEAA